MSDNPNDEVSSVSQNREKSKARWRRIAFEFQHDRRTMEYFRGRPVEDIAQTLERLSEEERRLMIRDAVQMAEETTKIMQAEIVELRERLSGQLKDVTVRYVAPERVRLVRPPRLAFSGLARLVLKPAAFKRYVEPAIADMHEEYFACLARRDERGAKIAVIKGSLYAVPGWAWAALAQLVLKLIGWIRA